MSQPITHTNLCVCVCVLVNNNNNIETCPYSQPANSKGKSVTKISKQNYKDKKKKKKKETNSMRPPKTLPTKSTHSK